MNMNNATVGNDGVETTLHFLRIGKGPIVVGSIDEAAGILSHPKVASGLGKKPGEYPISAKLLGVTDVNVYETVYCGGKHTNIGIVRLRGSE